MDKQNGSKELVEVTEDEIRKAGEKLWDKIKKVAKKAGKELIALALTLWYCLLDEDTPMWAKTTIVAAILYFVSPIDIIPDFLPGGLVDDLAVLLGALKAVSMYVKPEHRKRAREWVDEFFG